MKKVKKSIILDFNRTIYNPDTKRLIPYASHVLRIVKARGYTLYLITRAEPSRKALLQSLGITNYFAEIIISNKSKKDFEYILSKQNVDKQQTFVVGDRVRKEIRFGNILGLTTIWIKAGKFANELPRFSTEQPTKIITQLRELTKILT
jgi:putative hydrolase of the HAD superfamily